MLLQALRPIQETVRATCSVLEMEYGGIDASINPGLALSESVGAGLESLLFFPQKATSSLQPAPAQQFGLCHCLQLI